MQINVQVYSNNAYGNQTSGGATLVSGQSSNLPKPKLLHQLQLQLYLTNWNKCKTRTQKHRPMPDNTYRQDIVSVYRERR